MCTQPGEFDKRAATLICMGSLSLLMALMFCGCSSALPQGSHGTVQEVHTLYPSEWNVPRPAGLAYSTGFGELFLLDKNTGGPSGEEGAQIVVITPYEQFVGVVTLDFASDNAINMAFDDGSGSLFLLNQAQAQLAQIKLDANGLPELATLKRFDIGPLGLSSPQGIAVDAANEHLFILDSATSHVISMALNADIVSTEVQFSTIDLSALAVTDLRGIAVHPFNHHLYVASPSTQKLYELTQRGQLVTSYDLSVLELTDPRGFVFAPSADTTDPPATIDLFLADSRLADNQPIDARGIRSSASDPVFLPTVLQPFAGASISAPAMEAADVQGNVQLLGEIMELALESELCHLPRQSFSTRVASSVDDAEEYSLSEPVRVGSSDLELVQDGRSHQTVGLRFTNVTIPAGAIILTATIALETDEVYTVATRVYWQDIPVWDVVAEEHQTPPLLS